jgi:hypothetical protein
MPERIRQDEFHLLFRHTTRLGASGNLIRTLPLSLRYLFLSREQSRGQTRARQRERESRDRREEGRVVDERVLGETRGSTTFRCAFPFFDFKLAAHIAT